MQYCQKFFFSKEEVFKSDLEMLKGAPPPSSLVDHTPHERELLQMFYSTISVDDLKRFERGKYFNARLIDFYLALLEKVSLVAYESYTFTRARGQKGAQLREPKKVKFFRTHVASLIDQPNKSKQLDLQLEDFFE